MFTYKITNTETDKHMEHLNTHRTHLHKYTYTHTQIHTNGYKHLNLDMRDRFTSTNTAHILTYAHWKSIDICPIIHAYLPTTHTRADKKRLNATQSDTALIIETYGDTSRARLIHKDTYTRVLTNDCRGWSNTYSTTHFLAGTHTQSWWTDTYKHAHIHKWKHIHVLTNT